jgi:CRP-like cAMP-binding protein
MSLNRSSYKTVLEELYIHLCRFMPLTMVEFGMIRQYAEIREFDKKVQVIKVGEMENYLNIVARGLVRKYLPVKNKELVVQLATEMHFINAELSFHYRIPSHSVIETIEPTVFISISYDNLQRLFEQFPKAERLGRLMISDLFVRTDQHYFDQLRLSTRERFLEYLQNHPHMLQRVPQKFIASYLNIKPETFSRLKHLVAKMKKTSQ